MYWWEKAALAARAFDTKTKKGTKRFGLITTNSIKQSFNRTITSRHLGDTEKPLSLLFAIPDHPWIDASDGAAVRIAMSVGARGQHKGRLLQVVQEQESKNKTEGVDCIFDISNGVISPDFRIGTNLLSATALVSNNGLCSVGYQFNGQGFLLEPVEAEELSNKNPASKLILKPWLGGRGIQKRQDPKVAIDACNLSLEELRIDHPAVFQHLSNTVLPERRENKIKSRRERWWIYGSACKLFRPALLGIKRMIVTSLTASNRIFVFAPAKTIADSTTVMFALEGGEHLALMSSRFHIVWVMNVGSRLGVGNDLRYNKTHCFDPFPFPNLNEDQKVCLRKLGEKLDAHRKRQLTKHPNLTLTQMYNVLEKLRASKAIEGKDREIYDQGLITILKDLHDQIDTTVAEAYGWPADLGEEDILLNLVSLNKERAKEEATGQIRWLRSKYQSPEGQQAGTGKTIEMDLSVATKVEKIPWPKALPDRIAAVREVLSELGEATPEQIARRFMRAQVKSVQPLLESLAALGQAEKVEDGRYAA